ncbi:MAG: LamG domain-containing protein [Verrucomicrobia bacterium]|nr:LamG domain-containing protein [Verrucomicrobiota bacterium]
MLFQTGLDRGAPMPMEGRCRLRIGASIGLAVGVLLSPSARADNTVLDFGAVNGSAIVANSPALNPVHLTVETWFLARSFYGDGTNPLVDKPYYSHSSPYYQYSLWIAGEQQPGYSCYSGFILSIGGSPQNVVAENAYTVGQWHHVAGTYDGETICLYINGDLVASNTAPSGPLDAFATDLNIASFGGNYPAAATPVALEELRIWSYARSQSEIQAAMNQELTGAESGLIAYYNFNTPSTTTLVDQTGHHNGTLSNITLGQFTTPSPIPEPGSVVMIALGVGGLALRRRLRRRRA